MNPFDRARRQAFETREALVGLAASLEGINSVELLAHVEEKLEIAIEPLPFGHPILGGGSGVLKREIETVYIRNDVSPGETAYLIAHELGHWYLDGERPAQTIAHLSSMTASYGSQATVAVEAYGARERLELQANVFARELLLPRGVASQLFQSGMGATNIASHLQIPLEIVRLQLFDGILLPILPPAPPPLLPPMTQGQRDAATATDTFVNVVAGTGTGKTTTLIHRIKHLVEQGVPPSQILVLTFTNKAAYELVERLKVSGITGAADVWAGTFHAFGLEFLRKYHDLFGLPSDVHLADPLMQVRLMVSVLPKVQLKYYLRLQNPYDWVPDVLGHIKRLKEECLKVTDYRARLAVLPPCEPDVANEREDIATLFEAYEAEMRAKHLVDYVDLIAFPANQAKQNRTSVAQYTDHFSHVLVDEYQDVTEVMVDLLRQLALNAQSFWVVGDVRQAIHHWRGASIRSLMNFDSTFLSNVPGATVRRYALDLNRRSTPEILELFSCAGLHHALNDRMALENVSAFRPSIGVVPTLYECDSKSSQAVTIAQRIDGLVQRGVPYKDQVVISRKSANVEQIVEALEALNIPVLHIGDVCQRPEIKRLLCLMELLCMRQPRSLVGLMAEPALRMPPQDIEHLMFLTRQGAGTGMQRGRWLWLPTPGLSLAGQQAKANLAQLLRGLKRNSRPWDFVSKLLLDQHFGLPNPADQTIQAHTQRLAIWLFVYAVRNGDGDVRQARLSQFLLREELRRRIGEKLGDRGLPPEARALDAVSVMTVHSSKGLEYPAVHVTDVDDASYGANRPYAYDVRGLELIPPEVLNSSGAEFLFEERVERNNLLYVALSRARDYLYLYEVSGWPRPVPLNLASPSCLMKRPGIKVAPVPIKPIPLVSSSVMPRVSYEAFQTYMSCPLQYHYRHELALTAEQEIDVSIRARWAIMDMLLAVARDGVVPSTAFHAAWEAHHLPSKIEDPGLTADAVAAAKRGLQVIKNVSGTVEEGMVSTVNGVNIELPWMLTDNRQLHWIRAQTGIQYTIGHLRPMMLDINGSSRSRAWVYSVVTDQNVVDGPSKKAESTNVYKMAARFAAGDRSASRGRHCGRCAYLSVCDSIP
ncbi:UvrD-helicase domain-containing protein [Pseudomonas syringae]|uniref:UvrD-helicase domain-containing protein n=1 Tax=Pseudomonas syringae TaxID=317 RepID=UPI0006E53741|nr:UvrD-helicase domain-containing protein [Pseudomonas syringae]KPY47212.1 DNA/RNA helicase, superfamily I [Pseudomonas syringae pv. rhaphiolepidis]KWS40883.1 AAA family ATPase [Pseudomonas syringae pv. rhaphiolepidis]